MTSRVPLRNSAEPVTGASSFSELTLNPALLDVLTANGITIPTPIQAATLPDAIAGRDVLGRAQTGSGKTLAFGLALLTKLAGRRARSRTPLALILVPTRELAQQVTAALIPYASAVNLRLTTVVGGLPIGRQADFLRRGVEIVIATPGRLTDLLERGDCHLDEVAHTVLDEADQMADMGFLPQVTALLERTSQGGQRMLFSATLDRDVDKLVRRFLSNAATHSFDPPAGGGVTTMDHHVLHVDRNNKNDTTAEIGARDGRVIMFVGTRHRADRLAKHLLASGVPAAALHGGKTQPQRTRILDQFRTGRVNALIATDVAARGIHVDDLDLVVNVDPPADSKDYLHRSGRTARAGKTGTVVTLVLPDQRRETTRLLQQAGVTAGSARVSPGDSELARITGARTPSGVPVEVAAQSAPRRSSAPPRSGGRPGFSRSGPPRTGDRDGARDGARSHAPQTGYTGRSSTPDRGEGKPRTGSRSWSEERPASGTREERRAPLQDGGSRPVRTGGGGSASPSTRAARAAAGPNSWAPREGAGGKRLGGARRHSG